MKRIIAFLITVSLSQTALAIGHTVRADSTTMSSSTPLGIDRNEALRSSQIARLPEFPENVS